MESQSASGFPTLAEQLAHRASLGTPCPTEPLVAFVEDAAATPEALADLPPGTLVVTPAGKGVDKLVEVVRSNQRDVLLVSDAKLLTRPALSALRRALADDSACTSVSVDDNSRPFARGLPPPGIDFPRAGVVLVRRDDLLLAVDEADLTARFVAGSAEETGGGPIVAALLSLLERPGFIHRACGLDGEVPPARVPDRRRVRPASGGVVIDGSCLAHPLTGTQVQVIALVDALARAGADIIGDATARGASERRRPARAPDRRRPVRRARSTWSSGRLPPSVPDRLAARPRRPPRDRGSAWC